MRFSDVEKQSLLKAWIAISLAFALLYQKNFFLLDFGIYFLMSLFTVGLGFLLHEIAHKHVAQKYGCWAEFRSDDRMLIFAVIAAFLFGFVFAAPGAVMISGRINKEKNGKISLAGPLTNIVLAVIFLIAAYTFKNITFLVTILFYGFKINAFIAFFNMLPLPNFDGSKIIRWNKVVYFVFILISFVLSFLPIDNLPL